MGRPRPIATLLFSRAPFSKGLGVQSIPRTLSSSAPRVPKPARNIPYRHASTVAPSPPPPSSPFAAIKTTLGVITTVAVGGLLFVYLSDTRAGFYRYIAMPFIHAFIDPEDAHKLAVRLCKLGLVPRERVADDERLGLELWGTKISNPIGLAAGFDKNAEGVDALLDFGFGLVEIGSVTPKPQPGNPKPRMFRLPTDKAVINRYGFNSDGHAQVSQNLKSRLRNFLYRNAFSLSLTNPQVPESHKEAYIVTLPTGVQRSLREGKLLGVNLGKNKISLAESNEDYVKGVEELGPYGDYLVVNISSPNTPGLRALQRREPIEQLMREVKAARDEKLPHHPPLLVKIAPDLSDDEIADIAAVVKDVGVDGVIISNTTISRPDNLQTGPRITRETGGLSGPPVFPLALNVIRKFYTLTDGKVPIIGCGGVRSGDDAIAFAKAGASLVQLYTGFSFEGPGLVREIKDDVTQKLKEKGLKWGDLVGGDHRK
ncbi:Dihydroorotate dehydrogenase (quinone), mitochondrial [Rhizophlyctis rosea]|nr:Dihydroorotate dehydrogenase (quinone), mitochondrial [Rhizophlyctis rosea]